MINPWYVVAAIVAWCCVLAETMFDDRFRLDARTRWGACATFVLALVARLALTVPSFVHANFHGARLVDAALAFPGAPPYAEYGPVGFTVLGAIGWLVGDSFETIRVTNCVLSSGAVCMLALFARNVTGRDAVGVAAATLGVTSIPLMRIASSEDVHNVGLLLSSVGLYAVEVHLRTTSRGALVLAVTSLLAMLFSRQTYFMLIPVALLSALGQQGCTVFRQPRLVAAALLLVAPMLARLIASLHTGDATTYRDLAHIVRLPGILGPLLRTHPLLDVVRFGPLTTVLLVVGLVRGSFASRHTRAIVAGFVLVFLITLPFEHPTPGVELAFRLPALIVGVVVGSFGGGFMYDAVVRRVSDPRGRSAAGIVLTILTVAAPLASPSTDVVRRSSTDYLEYAFLERHLGALPHGSTLAILRPEGRMPEYAPSMQLIERRPDLRVVDAKRLDGEARVYFLAGVQCWGYALEEFGPSSARRSGSLDAAAAERIVPAIFGGRWKESGFRPPRGMRPECRDLLEGSVPFGPRTRISAPIDDVPFVAYSGEPFDIGFYALSAR